jgi:hypothetical protein
MLGGGLLAAAGIFLAHVRNGLTRRREAVAREQLLFENRLRLLTQAAVSAMRAEVRRSHRDA